MKEMERKKRKNARSQGYEKETKNRQDKLKKKKGRTKKEKKQGRSMTGLNP